MFKGSIYSLSPKVLNYIKRTTNYYASPSHGICQLEVRKGGQTVGMYWLSIGLVLGYIYPNVSTGGAAKDNILKSRCQHLISIFIKPILTLFFCQHTPACLVHALTHLTVIVQA